MVVFRPKFLSNFNAEFGARYGATYPSIHPALSRYGARTHRAFNAPSVGPLPTRRRAVLAALMIGTARSMESSTDQGGGKRRADTAILSAQTADVLVPYSAETQWCAELSTRL